MNNNAISLKRHLNFSLEDKEEILNIIHALDSPTRLDVFRTISIHPMINLTEISKILHMPMSTVSVSIKTLKNAGLIETSISSGKHGEMCLCWIHTSRIYLHLTDNSEAFFPVITIKVPIGSYISARNIVPSCGINSEFERIGEANNPSCFYDVNRLNAQLVWFHSGYLDYRMTIPDHCIKWLELSFETCSEAPGHMDNWPSDISVIINDHLLGIWTSPADCGGRHGLNTPKWWYDNNTQFGYVITWHVDDTGTYLNSKLISSITLADILSNNSPFLDFSIGVEENAVNCGGINLFGEKFGDSAQGLLVRFGI